MEPTISGFATSATFTDASSIVNSAAILLPCSLYRSALGTSTQLLLVLLSDIIDYGRMAGGLHDH